jgi:hypothetical protein
MRIFLGIKLEETEFRELGAEIWGSDSASLNYFLHLILGIIQVPARSINK